LQVAKGGADAKVEALVRIGEGLIKLTIGIMGVALSDWERGEVPFFIGVPFFIIMLLGVGGVIDGIRRLEMIKSRRLIRLYMSCTQDLTQISVESQSGSWATFYVRELEYRARTMALIKIGALLGSNLHNSEYRISADYTVPPESLAALEAGFSRTCRKAN
jgi:hypothetical protein